MTSARLPHDQSQLLAGIYTFQIDNGMAMVPGGVVYVDKFETGAKGGEVEHKVEHWALFDAWTTIVAARDTAGDEFTVKFKYEPGLYNDLAAFQADVEYDGKIGGTTVVRYIECRCFQLPKV